MSTLDVLLDGVVVAELDDAAGGGMAALRYSEQALQDYPLGAPLLSTRLPVQRAMYSGMETRAWLDGLLPEGSVRDILAARAKLDSSDLVGFLRVYGRDCAGAVSVVDANERPDISSGVAWLDSRELESAIRVLPRAPFGMSTNSKVRISLGGVQGKLAIVVEDERIGLPEGLQPSTHILKPEPRTSTGEPLYPGIVTAEALCMQLFRHLGLATADVDILNFDTGPALLVTRYDRRQTRDGLHRLHQEDLCQAIGLPGAAKYRDPSTTMTPSLAKILDILRGYQGATLPVMREVLGRVFANVLITNCDAHGKNWSLMLPGTGVELAPVYDVVPSTLWPDVDTELAMSVGGRAEHSDVSAEQLINEAESWGMGPRAARTVLRRLHDRVPDALASAVADVTAFGGDDAVMERVTDIVRAQLTVLAL